MDKGIGLNIDINIQSHMMMSILGVLPISFLGDFGRKTEGLRVW